MGSLIIRGRGLIQTSSSTALRGRNDFDWNSCFPAPPPPPPPRPQRLKLRLIAVNIIVLFWVPYTSGAVLYQRPQKGTIIVTTYHVVMEHPKCEPRFAYAYAKRGQVLLCEQWSELHPKDAGIRFRGLRGLRVLGFLVWCLWFAYGLRFRAVMSYGLMRLRFVG